MPPDRNKERPSQPRSKTYPAENLETDFEVLIATGLKIEPGWSILFFGIVVSVFLVEYMT